GAHSVGATLSKRQAELAEKRAAEAGLAGKVEVRYQASRDVDDGPYDSVSSIGMFEHVGLRQLAVYFERCYELLPPGGRLLNHAISRPPSVSGSTAEGRTRFARRSFIDRYVFPDGELHEVGSVVSAIQRAGFEARHIETLREHYALTLRAWVANLEANWDACVADAGAARARIWRLYMAASVLQFEANRTQVHQVLATKTDGGDSGLPLRPRCGWRLAGREASREPVEHLLRQLRVEAGGGGRGHERGVLPGGLQRVSELRGGLPGGGSVFRRVEQHGPGGGGRVRDRVGLGVALLHLRIGAVGRATEVLDRVVLGAVVQTREPDQPGGRLADVRVVRRPPEERIVGRHQGLRAQGGTRREALHDDPVGVERERGGVLAHVLDGRLHVLLWLRADGRGVAGGRLEPVDP